MRNHPTHTLHTSDLTADSTLYSTTHDRQRRKEREIPKIDLLRARRNGMSEKQANGRIKYTYGGRVFIYDPRSNSGITSWSLPPNKQNAYSGTRFVDPILLPKYEQCSSNTLKLKHDLMKDLLTQQHKALWKSHSVLVIDMSGSMRQDDVNGARCRSDGVWMGLARNFVKQQLDEQQATPYDLVSVVLLKETAHVVLRCAPTDWFLYNTFLDFREWTHIKPSGHGNYAPALAAAEELLGENDLGSCSLSLLFFSDGRPSDRSKSGILPQVGKIASRFGRRLTFSCIGMADAGEDFSTLEKMVEEARSYGVMASFSKPTLSMDALATVISSMATSLASSRTELTDLKTGSSRSVRTDIVRERSNAPDDIDFNQENWNAYWASSVTKYTAGVWTWHEQHGTFVPLIDPRCALCYVVVADSDWNIEPGKGDLCEQCKAVYFCPHCAVDPHAGMRTHQASSSCSKKLQDRRQGLLARRSVPSFSVAVKKQAFGEGAERVAFKFRFIDEHNNFFGPRMVAKESRFVEDKASNVYSKDRRQYHTTFMRTQALASRFANLYNKVLDEELPTRFPSRHHALIRKFPRIRFLFPLIFELVDHTGESRKVVNVLVEPMIEGKYGKFNTNMGYIKGRDEEANDMVNAFDEMTLHHHGSLGHDNLGIIEEGSESEEESDDCPNFCFPVQDEDFAQAFSHFTYVRSNRRLMVVDLQGALQIRPDGSREFVLTDPAIHKKHRRGNEIHSSMMHKLDFGRTDRGSKGIQAFFETHVCSNACRLLGIQPHED